MFSGNENYFAAQVAGLSQITGEFMQVRPLLIDLGWGELKSSLVTLKDADFTAKADAAANRKRLLGQYVEAFRHVEAAKHPQAASALKDLSSSIASAVVTEKQPAVRMLIDARLAKLS